MPPLLKRPSNKFCQEHKIFIKKIATSCAKRYSKNPRWDRKELESVAWVSFLESYATFDESKNISFEAYASNNIINAIHHFISVNMFTLKTNYVNIKKKPEVLNGAIDTEKHLKSIDYSYENEDSIQANVPASGYGTIKDIIKNDTKQFIQSKLQNLSPLQKQIIRMRFVEDMTLDAIGQSLGYSKSNILIQYNQVLDILKDRLQDVRNSN